ncbi:MAG: GMC family oxidoreductase N-terminal domain-containing protein [Sulfitobacter sp.]
METVTTRQNIYDYVIVGGGSAGCVIASRLSENPNISVCLIESGRLSDGIVSRMPLGNLLQVPRFPGLNNWRYETTAQQALNNRRGYQPRGRVLGGSSMINGMIYMRGRPKDFDQWADLGCHGWAWQDVLPYFLKSENNSRRRSEHHGNFGPLQVTDNLSESDADTLYLKAAQQAGLSENTDFNVDFNEGAGRFQVTQFWQGENRGERCSTYAAFIKPFLNRPNLHIEANVDVERVLFLENRATTVVALRDGAHLHLEARAEIILSAGTFGSPAILLRSGLGAGEHLQNLNIPVTRDRPQVGQNLQDHVQCGLHYACQDRRFMGLTPSGVLQLGKAALRWSKKRSGWGSTGFTQSGAFLKSGPDRELPDLQCHFFSGIVRAHGNQLHMRRGFSAHVYVLDPASRGSVSLASPYSMDVPVIDPAFLTVDDDMVRTARGLRRLHDILKQPALSALKPKEISTIEGLNGNDIRRYIAKEADTAYHPVGTCRMGSDEDAIVDLQLRVQGVDGLRVADASIMPRIISGNTNACAIMIAERAADFIKSAEHIGKLPGCTSNVDPPKINE